ncbi:hypothetical protein CEXT_72881, partial [Caerostris extrusa]
AMDVEGRISYELTVSWTSSIDEELDLDCCGIFSKDEESFEFMF